MSKTKLIVSFKDEVIACWPIPLKLIKLATKKAPKSVFTENGSFIKLNLIILE
jgi:hypothetical protein